MSDNSTSGEEQREERELGPSTVARRVRDSVLIKERRGNLVNQIFIDEEDWEQIGELFGRYQDTDE